jgi:hypothetical protein
MTITDDAHKDAVHEAARALAVRRWGSTKVDRAAAVVIERYAELGEALRAELHQVTEREGGDR